VSIYSNFGPRTPSIRPRDIPEQAIEDVELSRAGTDDVWGELLSFEKGQQTGRGRRREQKVVSGDGGGDSVDVGAHSCCIRRKVYLESPLMYLFCTIAAIDGSLQRV